MVDAAIEGKLDDVHVKPHPIFQVLVPVEVPGVPAGLLDARSLWKDGAAYDLAVANLAARFRKNFAKFGAVEEEILAAEPLGR